MTGQSSPILITAKMPMITAGGMEKLKERK
jgi:hypothetical protein